MHGEDGQRASEPVVPKRQLGGEACTTGALPARRWRIIVIAGSTATTQRSAGS